MSVNRVGAAIVRDNDVTGRSLRGPRRALVLLGLASATACTALLTPAAAQAAPTAAVNTTTSLVAAPNPAAPGATVTLTATVTAADGSSPAGSVQFQAGSTNIGTPVTVSSGKASTATTFATAGPEALAAVFTPASTAAYNGSTGSFAETVQTAGSTAGSVPISVAVPQTGTFAVTVGPGTVTLASASPPTTPDETATGTLNQVTVSDTRNYVPGWSVSGQESAFTAGGSGSGIPANSLGWTPTVLGSLAGGAVLGGAVAPVGANVGSTGPGLGSVPGTLAYAAAGCGFGTNVLSANLLLDVPSTTPPGSFVGTLTITYVETQPSGAAACVPVGVTF